MIIGIDLGTTNSLAAYLDSGTPRLIPNALGEELTPSVVAIDQGHLIVGRAAKEYQVLHPDSCASVFKRHMGTPWTTTLDGRTFTPEELSACVLRSLKQDAETHLKMPIERAVISVPAYFDDDRRRATIRAGQMAGLTVERIINEPTAAAIAYGLHNADKKETAVVFDLGGGTFDVSVVELYDGLVEVRASSGECFLGGEDFNRVLAARLLQSEGQSFEHLEMEAPVLVSRMIQQCERAKHQLSKNDQVSIAIPDRNGEIKEDARRATVTRHDFEQWTASMLQRCENPLRRALQDAGIKRTDVHEILLVGGATRMPIIARRIEEWFGKPPKRELDPDRVVALGAAVQAGLINSDSSLEDLVVTDVAPFTLGIEITKELGGERKDGYFLPIISRNTTIPVSRAKSVSTIVADQQIMSLNVYQGDARHVKDNLWLGELRVTGIPRGPAGQEVNVRFTYDSNGVLEVEATIVKTGKKASTVITRHAKELSAAELTAAVQRMESLKVDPASEYENRFLLNRAERVFRELPQQDRVILEQMLDAFESALTEGDAVMIMQYREALGSLLDRLEGNDVSGDNDDEPNW